MDKGNYKKLNHYHVIFLVAGAMQGTGILYISYNLSSLGYNQWLMALLFGVVANITLLPMIHLGLKYPNDTLYGINEKVLGKWLGKGMNILILFYCVLLMGSVSEKYIEIIHTTVLTNRGTTIPLILLLLLAIYIVSGGIKLVARFCIVAFFMINWMIILIYPPISEGTISHIVPIFNNSLQEVTIAFDKGYSSIFGYEMIMFYFPYIVHQKKALKHATIGIWIIIFLYMIATLTAVIYFSPWQLENLRYPLLAIFKAIEFTFIERLENILITLWVFVILSTIGVFLWVSKKGIDAIVGKIREGHVYISVGLVLILLLGPIPEGIRYFLVDQLMVYFGYGVILWPMVLLLVHELRSLGGRKI